MKCGSGSSQSAEVAKAYFDELEAPEKAFTLLSRTDHDPNQTMIDAQLEVLKTRVRPKTVANHNQ